MTQYEHHVHEEEDTKDVLTEDPDPERQVQDFIATHKPKRTIRKPARFFDMVVADALPVEIVEDSVPSTFKEAELSFESELWKNAMVEEIESLHMNDTWELFKLPKRKKAIECK